MGNTSLITGRRARPWVFIGYGGQQGQSIAEDACSWLQTRKMTAFAVSPDIEDSIPLLESEEKVLAYLKEFDIAVMVCTNHAIHSSRFRDETEKLVYGLRIPTVAFVMRGAPVLETLQLRTRVTFSKNRHRDSYPRLLRVLKKLYSRKRSRFGSLLEHSDEEKLASAGPVTVVRSV